MTIDTPEQPRLSVIGLGKLGASMMAAFSERGFEVVGVDVNRQSIDAINEGRAPVQETDLSVTIARNKTRIRAVESHEEAVLNSNISFVVVPTPSDDQGAFSLEYAERAFEELGKAIGKKSEYHTVVLSSTVLPGSTRHALLPILERESGKKAGRDFGLCYSPEFVALGSIIRDFLNADFTLVGELDEKCGSQIATLYSKVMGPEIPCVRMSLENAELTKISVNAYITTKVTFANMLADVCEKLPGGDVDVVTNAIGLDKRIGRKCLTGSLGYGGPCFPRDNAAFSFIAGELGVNAELSLTTDSMNRTMAARISERVLSLARKDATVAVLGLSYKPMSHVIDESPGLFLAQQLAMNGVRVIAFDPLSSEMNLDDVGRQIEVLDSLDECLQQAEVVLVTTPDSVFAELKATRFSDRFDEVLVFDFWRILREALQEKPNIKYIAGGTSEDDEANTARLKYLWLERTVKVGSTWS